MSRRSPRAVRMVNPRATGQSRHESFMAIAVLEMERHRRQHEADRCRARLRALDSRIDEIDREVAALLKAMPETPESDAVQSDPPDDSLRY